MAPSHPEYNWFKRNISKKTLYYTTGEKFADIVEGGFGRWYYRNGNVAMEYHRAEEPYVDSRCIVYSDGENGPLGKKIPITVLGAFDSLGNGVVYDIHGKERLKYNQSEGIILDSTIAPLSKWKWHTLNEPPVLQPVFVDNYVKGVSPCLADFISSSSAMGVESANRKAQDDERSFIEFENFRKEKADKMRKHFRSFQVKAKTVKLNYQFSLRIFDQANVNIQFSDGKKFAKFRLGLKLISNEIVDTVMTEASTVGTPYDRIIPRSESVSDIQKQIENTTRGSRNLSEAFESFY